MRKSISKSVGGHELEPVSLSELIHQHVRVAVETAVHEELRPRSGRVLTSAVKSDGATAMAREWAWQWVFPAHASTVTGSPSRLSLVS
jgi:hypothetical protein